MFRLHFAYICLYQVFEYHMEFLETFGCIWSSRECLEWSLGEQGMGATSPERHHQVALTSLLERPYQSDREKSLAVSSLGDARTSPERPPGATPRSRCVPLPRATCPERRTEVARISHPSRSDLPKRHPEVARVSMARRHEAKPGATSQSDLSERHAEVEGLEGQEELCFINNNGSWYKKEPNFQYNNYQQKSYPNNQQSGYPPRNNQQGSYQPQQNPSSGSSAPQESSTDTLLKQILESQTRSEKQVGYELKNLHSKIDGSYNELNNKFSHLASTVFEYHMEFLETFGFIWSSRECLEWSLGEQGMGATSPERHHQARPPYWSDLEVARGFIIGDARTSPERPGATLPRATTEVARHPSRRSDKVARVSIEAWSDLSERPTELPRPEPRSDKVAPRLLSARFLFYLRAFWLKVDSMIDHLPSLVRYLITQGLIPMPMSSLFPYALISLRTGSTIFYTTTFVLGALKTPNIKPPSGYSG
ncbi:hypothetical protein IGI04_012530 [Brassica rapa subsp. trilocularis]|uniref:Uncharacterized protein n=1 Tax=Brassica rapa subsp. trilocularis TaxID=1813537 RepID=A0ABQ7N668_BRACM|nr:hypothetical protein IGI04_012530 [Brassica rapa subsp. trilocularis]